MLSSHPCSSEGVLLLSSIVLDDAAAACIYAALAFSHLTWPAMAVTCGR